jgi:hypothetical protein
MVSCFMLPLCRLAALPERGNPMSADEVFPVPNAPTDRPALRALSAVLAAAVLLLAGCGLADYEARMSSEAALVANWDDEEKVLGDPINTPELPKTAEGKDVIWNIFLRLPRGVSNTPLTQPNATLAQLYGGLLGKYAGGNNSAGLQNVFVGLAVDDKDYPAKVLGAFSVPAGGEALVGPPVPRSTTLRAFVKDLTPDVPLKRKVYEEKPAYSFNFYEHGTTQVAVVYQTADKEVLARAAIAIRMSLSTLAEGADADKCRSAYTKTHRPAPRK